MNLQGQMAYCWDAQSVGNRSAQMNVGLGGVLFGFSQQTMMSRPLSKLQSAQKYAADVRVKNPLMQVTRIRNEEAKNGPVVDPDPVPAGTAAGNDSGISTAECH